MNRKEHLLIILAEECSEVIKDITKSLRFGLDDYNPLDENKVTNKENIVNELNDLIAVADMLKEERIIEPFINQEKIDKKKQKVNHYLNYSKHKGTLE